MNFVRGGNLHDILFKQNITMTPFKRKHFSHQTANAVAYMHSLKQPVIHHDLKPANILVERPCWHVYVCDMGLASTRTTCQTLTKILGGTPYYAAPETYLDVFSKTSDVWSFGLILVEVYAGKAAWGDIESNQALYRAVCFDRSGPPAICEVSEEIRTICQDCLEHDFDKRPTMTSVAERLRDIDE
jgi:serine/threonine protein kinase